jgi:hypothetical protein
MSILIRFLHEVHDDPDVPDLAIGQIALGAFVEEFEMILSTWSRARYEQQWSEGIQRLINGESKSCLITSFWSEGAAFGGEWWKMYRVANEVVIQNQLIRPEFGQDFNNFDPDNPYPSIPDRRSVNEDGQQVSEWFVPFNQITPWSSVNNSLLT